MASTLEIVEAGRKLRELGDFSAEDEAKLAAAEARISASVDAGRRLLADDQLSFDDFKKLKKAEITLGLRQPEGPGFGESAKRIAANPAAAAKVAGNLATKTSGRLATGIGQLARSAVRAVATPVRSAKAAKQLASETAQELASPEGVAAAIRGVADVTGLGGQGALQGLRLQALRKGIKISDADLKDFAEFEDARQRARKGKALGAGQLVGGFLLGGGRTAAGAAARGAGAAGAVTASQGGSPEDIVTAGLAGAALPGVAQGTGKLAGLASRPVTTRFPGAEGSAARAALGRIVENPEDVGRTVSQIGSRTGEPASLAAGLPEAEAAKFGQTVAVGAPETQQAIAAAVRRSTSGQGKRIVRKAGPTASADDIRTAANDRLDRVLQTQDRFGNKGLNLGSRSIPIPLNDVKRFSENPFFGSLPSVVRRKFGHAIDKKKSAVITLSQLDETRRAFDTSATRSTDSGKSFLDASGRIRELGIAKAPRYGEELAIFAEQQFRADAVKLGRAALSKSKTAKDTVKKAERLGKEAESLFDISARKRAKASRQGFVEGANSVIVSRAGRGPKASTALLRELVDSSEFKQKIASAFGGREAAGLVRTARADLKRTTALGIAGAAARQGAREALSNANLVNRVIEGSIIAGGKASGGFQATFAERLITALSVPKNVARRMARDALDPAQAPKLIKRLKARKVNDKQIVDLYRRSAIEAGIPVGEEQ